MFGFALGVLFGCCMNLATSGTTAQTAGVASALVTIGQQVGGAITGTAVYARAQVHISAGIMFVAAILAFLIYPRRAGRVRIPRSELAADPG